ncbi:LysR family transcriptional regulator [Vibrio inusitatus NBRC 102082]|uniref:LysR family transcriptional regulator n=1 Tax=Vibrio inusitatus NBRC 102082 TaxID=1219070 RepID=A0A4Y3HV26_9VIBR|nr:transcriptional regulator GcvA [Vibrio inusitatus]GEA50907.1 LysR family transcriptional regulator [Vibrio inusitatus NBRC 102082]
MKIPVHLNALKAFEASARHRSFSGAASELYVTPAAVGQLVRSLEDWVGEPLFYRSNSGKYRLTLTETAQRALPDIQLGFEKLSLGLEHMQKTTTVGALNVTVSPAFAAKWLLPKLHRFQSQWPDIDVRLDMRLKSVDFSSQNIDIGVRYGLGKWPGLDAERLMTEEVFPVCSPILLGGEKQLSKPKQILKHTLVHDLSVASHKSFPTWEQWLDKASVSNTVAEHNLRINNSAAVLQSAIDGVGVALARSVMVRDDLVSGRLVRLFPDITFDSPLAYYIVYRRESFELSRVQAFRQWLLNEVNANHY